MSAINIGRTIIVTGATSGIGREVVRQLDTASNHLILIGRSADTLEGVASQLVARSTVVAVDLAEMDSLAALLSQLPQQIHGYVHAAGLESVAPLKMISHKKIDHIMRVHLYSFLEILKAIDKRKKAEDKYVTSVVAMSSVASDCGGVGQTMYAASKAALEAAVRVLSKELTPKKIRINAVKPGFVDTEMTRRWMRRIGIANISSVEAMQLNGVATPDDVANLVSFLLSEQSYHIVGTHIKIDGGGPASKVF